MFYVLRHNKLMKCSLSGSSCIQGLSWFFCLTTCKWPRESLMSSRVWTVVRHRERERAKRHQQAAGIAAILIVLCEDWFMVQCAGSAFLSFFAIPMK